MYCESCGNQIDESLNYCNSCGTQLRGETRSQKSLAFVLVGSLTVIVILGLIIVGSLLVTLLDRVSRPEPVFVFAMVFLLVLFGVCFMIMRQVSRLIDHELKAREVPKRKGEPLVQLPPKSTAQLDEFREPASVTDHTTRTLDEVQVPRKA